MLSLIPRQSNTDTCVVDLAVYQPKALKFDDLGMRLNNQLRQTLHFQKMDNPKAKG